MDVSMWIEERGKSVVEIVAVVVEVVNCVLCIKIGIVGDILHVILLLDGGIIL